jgi:sulfonate dioxygenase
MSQTLTQTIGSIALGGPAAEKKTYQGKWFSETGLGAEDYPYKAYLPTFDASLNLPPLQPFEHVEPGLKALDHAEPKAFLKNAHVQELTPEFGSEVSGVRLDQLDEAGRQQLSLFVAERGVVAFRGQKAFIDQDPDWLINNWTSFFGRPHIHPVSAAPEGHPEFHLV